MSNVGIYKITSPNNKVYIGQSWDLEKREYDYKWLRNKNQRKVQNSVKKYGWEAHKFEILMYVSENVTQQMFDEIEQHYMDYYRKLGFELMNLREAGSRGKHSEESKKKMSEAQKGKKPKPESVAKMVATKTGCKLTEAHKAKLRESALRITDEAREQRRKRLVEARSKWSFTEESIDKMRAAKRESAVAILQCSKDGVLIRQWDCIHEAARQLGINHANIITVAHGKRKTAGGFIWKYKDETNQ